MPETQKQLSPPYATYGQFMGFLNTLQETGVPSRIDPSVFGNASGKAYSIISALKFLKLIDENGAPAAELVELVKAKDDARGPVLKPVIQKSYQSLFKPTVHLTSMTAGQFDEHVRQEYGVAGSTVDKIALFFVAACAAANIPISTLLQNRKPVATSAAAKKSVKQRRRDGDDELSGEFTPPPTSAPAQGKALEYQLIDLMSDPGIDPKVKESIWSLVQYLTARKAQAQSKEGQ